MAIEIVLRPSRRLALYLLLVTLLALYAIARIPLASPYLFFLALTVLLPAYYQWQTMQHRSISRLSYRHEQWAIERGGEPEPVELYQATVWQFLVALNFRSSVSGKKKRLLVLSDSCGGDEFRQLKVLLRHFPVLV